MKTLIKIIGVWLISSCIMSSQAEELKIGTGHEGGSYFPMGNSITELVNKYSQQGTTFLPVLSAGSEQNLLLLASGDVDLALSNNKLVNFALARKGHFRNTEVDLKAVAALHPSVLHMVVLKDSKINTIEDLKGKKVAVGPSGGGTIAALNFLLPLHDISLQYMSPRYLSYTSGLKQLADGWVDAAFLSSGYPASALSDVINTGNMRIISFSEGTLVKVLKKETAYKRMVIPKHVYKTKEDINTIGIDNLLMTTGDVPPEIVEDILHSVFSHFFEFTQQSKYAEQISPKMTLDLTIPLHSGSERYFKELGLSQ